MATADSLKALRNTLKGLGEAKAQLEHIKRLLPRANGEDLATLRDCKEKVDGFVEVFKTDYDACLKDGWRSGLARAIAVSREFFFCFPFINDYVIRHSASVGPFRLLNWWLKLTRR